MNVNDLYRATGSKTFKVIAIFNPNEESDPWVEYINIDTQQVYSCRQEAFLSRFSLLPQPR